MCILQAQILHSTRELQLAFGEGGGGVELVLYVKKLLSLVVKLLQHFNNRYQLTDYEVYIDVQTVSSLIHARNRFTRNSPIEDRPTLLIKKLRVQNSVHYGLMLLQNLLFINR